MGTGYFERSRSQSAWPNCQNAWGDACSDDGRNARRGLVPDSVYRERSKRQGIFDAEFKYDERDGQYKIVEVNARPWWFVEFATRCGVDLCGMAYQDALGLPVEPNHGYEVGRRCVYLLRDLATYRATDRSLAGLLRWARSVKGADEIIYCWDDPRPGISSTLASITKYLRQTLRGLLSRH